VALVGCDKIQTIKTKKLKIKDKRTILTVAIGKLSGCLLGGGIVLTMAWSILNVA